MKMIETLTDGFFLKLLTNGNLKQSDRDGAIGLMFRYANFQEYYDEVYKSVPFPKFSTIDKLYESLIRNYFASQLKPLSKHFGWPELEVDSLISSFISSQSKKLISELLEKLPPITIKEIEEKYNIGFALYKIQ